MTDSPGEYHERLEERRPDMMALLQKQGEERDAKEPAQEPAEAPQGEEESEAQGEAPDATESTGEALEAASEDSTGQEQEQTQESDQRVVKARRLAELEGLPAAVVDRMSEEELLEWSKNARSRIAKTDEAYRTQKDRIQALEQQLGGQSENGAQIGEEEPERAAPAGQTFDTEAVVKPFEDEFGPEAAGVLRKITDHFAERDAQRADDVRQLRAERLEERLVGLRRDLGERFPGLSTEEGWASVREEMTALAGTGRYSEKNLPDLVEAASLLAFRDQAAPRPPDPTDDSQRDQGTLGTGRRKPPKSMTPEEKRKKLFQVIASGQHDGDPRKARRLAGLD